MSYRIGIDLGGTKIEIIALSNDHKELLRKRIATPQGSYPKTLQAIASLIRNATATLGFPDSIGIGIPGAISPATGLIKNANSVCLNGQRLDLDLEQLINSPIQLANDADCFALSESTDGAGQDYNSVFGVILGTGVGGGIVINNQIIRGPNAITGEWGHNPLPWLNDSDLSGRPCYCGKQDCIETYLSGPGFSRSYNRDHNCELSSETIWHFASEGDQHAQAHCDLYLEQLAKSLASIINVFDPEIIVLGGGMSNIDRIYQEVPSRLENYVFSDSVITPIVKARHGDSSGVRGAAWL